VDTPVYDFIEAYKASGMSRFHMPGHKGAGFSGCEDADITEIEGADVLYGACGIIARSQDNAARLFSAGQTFYSTEGSSLCIKAMLMAVLMDARQNKHGSYGGEYILAARNVHRAMVDACALIGIDADFIMPGRYINRCTNICSGMVTPQDIENYFLNLGKNGRKDYPVAVYITSPGYLGDIAATRDIAAVCEKYNVPLIVDNAHGAYLAFLGKNGTDGGSLHPIKLGAAMCCDSAHKTLPVLTGGAYLHISPRYKERYAAYVQRALALFGSTSPSYLILQSLDLCNRYIADGYNKKLEICINLASEVKEYLIHTGIDVLDTEPLKIVIDAAASGYTGHEAGQEMRRYKIACEYADMQYVVLMVSPCNSPADFENIKRWGQDTCLVKNKRERLVFPAIFTEKPCRCMPVRKAVFSPSEIIRAEDSAGRICASETVSCPPAVPVAICGEIIDENMVSLFRMYNIENVCVVSL